MEKHINVVAALRIGFSILGIIIAGLFFTLFHFIGDFVDDHEAEFVLSIIANIMMALVTILSIPGIIAGIGLFKRKEWARILTLILSPRARRESLSTRFPTSTTCPRTYCCQMNLAEQYV